MDSRSALNYTSEYPPAAEALQKLKHDVVLDGEVVILNEARQPDFDALQILMRKFSRAIAMTLHLSY